MEQELRRIYVTGLKPFLGIKGPGNVCGKWAWSVFSKAGGWMSLSLNQKGLLDVEKKSVCVCQTTIPIR